MTCATFGKSCGLASCSTSDATTRMSYGDRPMAWAVSTNPDFMYSTAPARQDRPARPRRVHVESPGGDQPLDPAVVLAELVDGFDGPRRHRQRLQRAAGRRRA